MSASYLGDLFRLVGGLVVLFGATVVGCVQLTNSLWSIAVAMGGIFAMFAWSALSMFWGVRRDAE